jgi:YD repeat-containing protein
VEVDGTRVTWSYDNSYQLKREMRSATNGYDITYSYDSAGSRKTMLSAGVPTTYAYDAANELLTLKDNTGTTTFTYDANGNQTVKTEYLLVPAARRAAVEASGVLQPVQVATIQAATKVATKGANQYVAAEVGLQAPSHLDPLADRQGRGRLANSKLARSDQFGSGGCCLCSDKD